jgi:hypothetical protein
MWQRPIGVAAMVGPASTAEPFMHTYSLCCCAAHVVAKCRAMDGDRTIGSTGRHIAQPAVVTLSVSRDDDEGVPEAARDASCCTAMAACDEYVCTVASAPACSR